MKNYDFSLHHPRAVEVYKPVAGTAPANDFVYLYLKIENMSAKNTPLSFARWCDKKQKWRSIFNRLKPDVKVISHNAPIVGEPKVYLSGLSERNICIGRHYPPNMPDVGDFPLNEANFHRDFAIKIKPDRSRIGQTGSLHVEFSLSYTKPHGPDFSVGKPVAEFSIPITITDRYRPETITAELSNHQP